MGRLNATEAMLLDEIEGRPGRRMSPKEWGLTIGVTEDEAAEALAGLWAEGRISRRKLSVGRYVYGVDAVVGDAEPVEVDGGEQLDLFAAPAIPDPDPVKLVRRTDPATSRKGAESVKYRAGTQKALLAQAYLAAGRPLSDAEAADAAGLLTKPGACWWHRASDLRADGITTAVGEGVSPLTGETVMVCELTDYGRTIAEQLARAAS